MQFLSRQTQSSEAPESVNNERYHVDPYILISILLETLGYGSFLVLFFLSTILLFRRRRVLLRARTESVALRSVTLYLVMGILMFFAITAKWCFWWAEVLPIPNGPNAGVLVPRLGRNAYRMKGVCIRITVLLGDIITIYRLWILGSRNRLMIAFPIAGFFGFLVCGVELSGRARGLINSLIPIDENGRLEPTGWHIGAISCTTSITVYVTSMIAWVLARARMRMRPQVVRQSPQIGQVLAVIIESASLYTIWNLFFIITGIGLKSKIALTFLDCIPVVYGISITLINVRVGLGWARSHDERQATPSRPTGGRGRRRCLPTSYAQRGVHVSTEVYAEPSGHSCVQSSVAEELEDVSAASSTTFGCPGDSKAIHSTV